MTEQELIRRAAAWDMPDKEAVRRACLAARPTTQTARARYLHRLAPAAVCALLVLAVTAVVYRYSVSGPPQAPIAPALPGITAAPHQTTAAASTALPATGTRTAAVSVSTAQPRPSSPVFNEWTQAPRPLDNIALKLADARPLTLAELIAYYGSDIRPAALPDGWEPQAGVYRIYRRDGGEGAVYYDVNSLFYRSPAGEGTLRVTASKGRLPFFDVDVEAAKRVPSTLHGHEVMLAHLASGEEMTSGEGAAETPDSYYAWFLADGVGYAIQAVGLDEDTFLQVVEGYLA